MKALEIPHTTTRRKINFLPMVKNLEGNQKFWSMRGPFRFNPKFTHGFSMSIRQIWLKKSPFASIHMGGNPTKKGTKFEKYFLNGFSPHMYQCKWCFLHPDLPN